MIHTLKTIQPYYSQVETGIKRFELRKNDRDYKVGDLLVLQEYDPVKDEYTKEMLTKQVTIVLKDCPQFGLMDGYCILGLQDF